MAPPGWRAALVVVAAAMWVTAALASSESGVEVAGRVVLAIDDMRVSDLGPVVVYLESVDPGSPRPDRSAQLEIRQRNASFAPGFLAVDAGSTVLMPNDDEIYHNVFSYSKDNEFDLGLYPAGESRSVAFETPGVVRMYCSIHESMNATVFVAPTPFFARVAASGAFELRGVPPGRYRLRTWCERLPETMREITVGPRGAQGLEIRLGADR